MKYCVASILPHSLKGEDGGGRPSRHERQSSFQGVARNDDDSDGDGNGVGERSIAPSGSDRYPGAATISGAPAVTRRTNRTNSAIC
jgi:hypothetical protein